MLTKSFNIEELLEGHPPRTNFNVLQLDGTYNVRVAEVTGRFPWHAHPNGDEGWLVWKGRLRIDLAGGDAVELGPGEGTCVPKGLEHSPVCLEKGTIVVVFNVDRLQHAYSTDDPDVGDFAEYSSY